MVSLGDSVASSGSDAVRWLRTEVQQLQRQLRLAARRPQDKIGRFGCFGYFLMWFENLTFHVIYLRSNSFWDVFWRQTFSDVPNLFRSHPQPT